MGAVPAAGRAGAAFVLQHALVDADRETARVVRAGPDLEFQIRPPRSVIGQWNEHAVGAFSTLGKIHACHLPTQLFPWRFSMPAERPGTQAARRAGIRVCNGDSEVGGPTVVIPAEAGIQGTPSLFRLIPYVRTENYIRDEPSSVSTPFDPSTSSGTGRGRNLPPLPPGEGRGEGKGRNDTPLQYRYASQCVVGEPPRRANSSIRHSSFRRCRVSIIRRRVSATRRRASSTSRNGSCILCRHSSV